MGPFPPDGRSADFRGHLPSWADREGQFVLIKGPDILGFFPRYEVALKAGYEQFGAGPFLIKQVLRHEPIYQVGYIEM